MLGCGVLVGFAERDRLVEGDGVAARLKAGNPDAASAFLGSCLNQCFNCSVQAFVDLVCAGERQLDGPGIRGAKRG